MPKVKADPDTPRAERAKKASAGSAKKRQYIAAKQRLAEVEKDNYTNLYVLRTPDGWWKMFWHSALIYKYRVADQLKTAVRLQPDTDYGCSSDDGCISFPDIKVLESRLKSLKIYPINRRDEAWVFELNYKVSAQDLQLMRDEEERLVTMTNRIIAPTERLVAVNTKVKELHKIIHECTRKLDGVSRDAFASAMSARMAKLQVSVIRAERGTADPQSVLEEAIDLTEDLYGYATVILNLRLLEPKKTLDLTHHILALRRVVENEIKKRALADAERALTTKAKNKGDKDES